MLPTGRPQHNEGYAALTALLMCAALSLVCAALLAVGHADRMASQRELLRVQQQEAIHAAVMMAAAEVVQSSDQKGMTSDKTVEDPSGGSWRVHVVAEPEARKWNMAQMEKVDDSALFKETSLSLEELKRLATNTTALGPRSDCVRSLFSDVGAIPPDQDIPHTSGALYISSGKAGEIWRIRAVLGSRVEERRVRFLGDTRRLFALLSKEEFALGEMPACTSLISHQ